MLQKGSEDRFPSTPPAPSSVSSALPPCDMQGPQRPKLQRWMMDAPGTSGASRASGSPLVVALSVLEKQSWGGALLIVMAAVSRKPRLPLQWEKSPWACTLLSFYLQILEFARKQHVVSSVFCFLKLNALLGQICKFPTEIFRLGREPSQRDSCLSALYVLYLQNASKYILFYAKDPHPL